MNSQITKKITSTLLIIFFVLSALRTIQIFIFDIFIQPRSLTPLEIGVTLAFSFICFLSSYWLFKNRLRGFVLSLLFSSILLLIFMIVNLGSSASYLENFSLLNIFIVSIFAALATSLIGVKNKFGEIFKQIKESQKTLPRNIIYEFLLYTGVYFEFSFFLINSHKSGNLNQLISRMFAIPPLMWIILIGIINLVILLPKILKKEKISLKFRWNSFIEASWYTMWAAIICFLITWFSTILSLAR